jgi:hypothetical protein
LTARTAAWLASVGGAQPFNYSDDFSTDGMIVSLLSQSSTQSAAVVSPSDATVGLGQGPTAGLIPHRCRYAGCIWLPGVRVWCQLPPSQGHPRLRCPLRGQEPC